MILEFRYHPDEADPHEDLVFRLGDFQITCDSYYFNIDPAWPEEDTAKTKKVIARLLDQWIAAVEAPPDGEYFYLPFDFSDQHIGCLRVKETDGQLELLAGWSEIGGYQFHPSQISGFLRAPTDFTPSGKPEKIPADDFLADLRRSRAAL